MTARRASREVVLLHGWGATAAVWDGLRARLSQRRFRVTAPDLPGYRARPACVPYTVERMAAVIARAAPRRCRVVAWSLGGMAALAWAASAPAQVERLAVIAATPCFVRRPGWPAAVARETFADFASTVASDPMSALQRFMALQVQGDERALPAARLLRRAVAAESDALEASLRLLQETDLRRRLASLPMPVLVLHGTMDGVVPTAAGKRMCRLLPSGRFVAVRGAAHAPFLSQPETVARALADFLDE